ncbi:MAG: hypothetical protein H7Y11_04050, partial [Armatimonadetes bacterium]|nr:hypothetical protein [Anaerolineae bacterium]
MRLKRNYTGWMALGCALLGMLLVGVAWASPEAAPARQANLFQKFLLDTQADVTLLAQQVFEGELPDLWVTNTDVNSVQFVADLWFDNELVADQVFGVGVRPPDWFGATSARAEILGRNVRHDVELTADAFFGSGERPEGWVGGAAIYRCTRVLQNVLRLLDVEFNTRSTTPDAVVDYCGTVSLETQDTLLTPIFANNTVFIDVQRNLGAVRGDLERLVDERRGVGNRPTGWSGNRDAGTTTFLDDLVRDLEIFTDSELGIGVRPPGWSRAIRNSPALSNDNLRFNLETLTDQLLGENIRPNGWQGLDPVDRCEPTVQTLVLLVSLTIASPPIPADVTDDSVFCTEIARVTNDFAENPPPVEDQAVEAGLIGRSQLAFSYLDVSALQYMGVMPRDVEFRAVFRNFNESNMMLVSGDDFVLFIDRRFTTLPEEVFLRLPTLENRKPLTFCDANWCNGPGPTPTPTGDGALVLLLAASTPVPTRDAGSVTDLGKRLVSWNN